MKIMTIFMLFTIGVLILGAFKLIFDRTITFKEIFTGFGVILLASILTIFIIERSDLYDDEIHNGEVLNKYSEHVTCEHSYSCNCYNMCSTDSNGNQSCTQICSTCYDHSFDVDWVYKTSDNGNNLISRVDRQGVNEPPRFTKVQIGEPSSSLHSYKNYFKADLNSILPVRGDMVKYKGQVPKYPQDLYDLYRINRFVSQGLNLGSETTRQFNFALNQINKNLNPTKQANVILVLVNNQPHDYIYALNEAWSGGKKNDVIFVLSLNPQNDNEIKWVEVLALNEDKNFNIKARNALMEIKNLKEENHSQMFSIIENSVRADFVRTHMAKYEYLMNNYTPSLKSLICGAIFITLLSFVLGIVFHRADLFNEGNY